MMTYGSFTHIYHPNNEKLFENANIDVLVFRYCKNDQLNKKVIYNDIEKIIVNTNGFITFQNESNNNVVLLSEYFDIYVGMVTGKEEVYKNENIGNITVLNGENKMEKYIYIEKYPSENIQINNYLLEHKDELIQRKIRKFNETNWYEWGAARNLKTINQYKGEQCIYVYNLTRKKEIAFTGTVDYFGGGLIMLKPRKKCNLLNVIKYLNSDIFKNNFMFSGRFKIGHRQLYNSYIDVSYL